MGATAGTADVHGRDGDADELVIIAFNVCPISVTSFGGDDGSSGARPAVPTSLEDLGELGGLSDGLGDVAEPITAIVDAVLFNCSNYQIMKDQIQHALGHFGHYCTTKSRT